MAKYLDRVVRLYRSEMMAGAKDLANEIQMHYFLEKRIK